MKRRRGAIIVAIIIVVGVTSLGLKQHRCNQRHAAFAQQVESIKQGANEDLRVGTKKADIARFFTKYNIPLSIEGAYAYGSIASSGCAPFGCGTDSALIVVRAKVDEAGAVTEEPIVSAIYTDCL